MALTDLKIKSIKLTSRPQKVPDADGMYLYVTPSGTKPWRMDYAFNGKRLTHTLGKYFYLTLAAVRAKRAEVKQLFRTA